MRLVIARGLVTGAMRGVVQFLTEKEGEWGVGVFIFFGFGGEEGERGGDGGRFIGPGLSWSRCPSCFNGLVRVL